MKTMARGNCREVGPGRFSQNNPPVTGAPSSARYLLRLRFSAASAVAPACCDDYTEYNSAKLSILINRIQLIVIALN